MLFLKLCFCYLITLFILINGDDDTNKTGVECTKLLKGQFLCPDPSYDFIDPKTQQPKGCTSNNLASVKCRAADGIKCNGTGNETFWKEIPCRWTNGYHFETTLLLSIFLGMFGVDRFYLGYPAIGLLKFCTLGFLFIGQLIDVVLIATQTVGPADGSYYVIPYYGARLEILRSNNETFRVPQTEWDQDL
ncbi:hypothetical protein V9T40_003887 [Parthenolecanium corni]|uniref:TM2 domain-containing protein n=1 Tax=Parthenolecanium corni TaxID=536013 RepID=A0AAN9Y2X0_9HEMI